MPLRGDLLSVVANLVTNPDFEVDAAGWFGLSEPTLSRTTAEQHSGVASLAVVCDGSASFEGAMTEVTEGFVAGERYTLAPWVKGTAGAALRLRVEDAGGAVHKTFTATGDWQRVAFNHVVAEGTSVLFVGVLVSGTQATTYYLDDVVFDLRVVEPSTATSRPVTFCSTLKRRRLKAGRPLSNPRLPKGNSRASSKFWRGTPK